MSSESLSSRISELSNFLTENRFRRLKEVLDQRTRRLLVVLEDIYDPHNGSACLRSCEACGIQEIHIVEERNAFLTVEGVTMGSARWLEIHRHFQASVDGSPALTQTHSGESIDKCYNGLREKGYMILAMTPHPDPVKFKSFDQIPLKNPIALVFGSERDGLTPTAMSQADLHTRLPIHGFVESYNISVACALTVFHLGERIRSQLPPSDWRLDGEDYNRILLQWLRLSIRNIEEIERQIERSSDPESV